MNGWKVTAIIFILITALETSLIGYGMKLSIEDTNKEIKCQTNICDLNVHTHYNYNAVDSICYCYTNDVITKQLYIE